MAEQINLANSDFNKLWKDYLCSVYQGDEKGRRKASHVLVKTLLASFGCGSIFASDKSYDPEKSDIVVRAIADVMDRYTRHFYAWDQVLLLEEDSGNRSYSLYTMNGCGVLPDSDGSTCYQVLYGTGRTGKNKDADGEHPDTVSYLFQVKDNGRQIDSKESSKVPLVNLSLNKKTLADKWMLQYQRLFGKVWIRTNMVEMDQPLTICPSKDRAGIASWRTDRSGAEALTADIVVSAEGVTVGDQPMTGNWQAMCISGPVDVKVGEAVRSLPDQERVILLKSGSIYWEKGAADKNSYVISTQNLFGGDNTFFDVFEGVGNEDWFVTIKDMEHCPFISDDAVTDRIKLGDNVYKVSLVPGIYMVKSPNKNLLDFERLIGGAWFKDESIALSRGAVSYIAPDPSNPGTIRIGDGNKKLLSGTLLINKSGDDYLLKYKEHNEEHIIDKSNRVEVQGPATVRYIKNHIPQKLTLSRDERIIFHSAGEPRLQVIKGKSIGAQFNSYVCKIIHNRLSKALKEAEALRARVNMDFANISEEQVVDGVEASTSTDAYFAPKKVPFEIPTDLGVIDAMSDFQVALLYCMNSREEGISEAARCFLVWHTLLSTSDDAKGDHILKKVQERLPDNHPDKTKDSVGLSKRHFVYRQSLKTKLKTKFRGIFTETEIDGETITVGSRRLSPEIKQEIENIRRQWREAAEKLLYNGSNGPQK